MSPLQAYLSVAAILFAIGFAGVVTRKSAIIVLMGIELMLNAANLNFVAFWKFGGAANIDGYIFVLFSIAIAAAESAVGLALVILIYKHFKSTDLEQTNRLHG
jgi:NADH:ubiquinone oxidoreductase subunit K